MVYCKSFIVCAQMRLEGEARDDDDDDDGKSMAAARTTKE
jgi:hypothetical protein